MNSQSPLQSAFANLDMFATSDKVETIEIQPQVKTLPINSVNDVFHVESILVFINGGRVTDVREKWEAITYVQDSITKLESSRLTGRQIPDIRDIRTISIQMDQKFQYEFGKGIAKVKTLIKNGKELLSIDALDPKNTQRPCWCKFKLSRKSKKAALNRKGTEFEIGMISPSGKIENEQAMNASEETKISFGLYEHSQTKNGNSHGTDGIEINKYHPEYILTSHKSEFCPHVISVRVNDKWIVSSLVKLDIADKTDRVTPTSTNRINTGLLGNWSQPFFLQLEAGQYLADKLGTEPIHCQIAMENQLLILYVLDNSFTRSDAVSASHSKKSFSPNLTQQRTKILTIGTIELSEVAISKWTATQPQYEILANLLNRSNSLPESIRSQYKGLLLTNETLSIADRVLCKKNVIGNKVLVKSYLDSKYSESHNQPKLECIWLDQLRNEITKKMLQANHKEVKAKVENYVVNNSDTAILKATHDVAKCTQLARSVIRLHQPNCSDSEIGRLAMLISKYIFTKLNLNKLQAIGLLQSLKTDVNQYIKLRDLVITPELDHLKEVVTPSAVYYR